MDASVLAVSGATTVAAAGPPAEGHPLAAGVYTVLLFAGLALDLWFLIRAVLTAGVWEQRIRRVLWRPWPERDGLLLVALLLLVHGLYLSVFGGLLAGCPQWKERLAGFGAGLQGALFQGFILLFAGGVLVRRRLSCEAALGLSLRGAGRRIRQGIGMYLVSVPPVLLCLAVTRLVLLNAGLEAKPQPVIRFFTDHDYALALRVYFLLIGIVAAPFAEEILFRGILLPWIARRVGAVAAAVIVSALFGGLHFNLTSFPALMAFGLVLAVAYFRSGALLVPITAHALFNAVNIVLLYARE